MTGTRTLAFILSGVLLVGVLPLAGSAGRVEWVSAQEAGPGTPVASPVATTGEPGPVFASGEWRISVVGAAHASRVNAVGLRRGEGKDWVVVVADVANMGDDASTLDMESFSLRFSGKRVKGFVPRSTASVAKRLDAEPADAEADVTIDGGDFARVVWVYRVAEDLENPEFTRDDQAVPLSSALLERTDLRALPPVTPPPALEPVELDSVVDGATISAFASESETNVTVVLAGVDAPLEDECFGAESAELLDDLVSDTIWLETRPGQATSVEAEESTDESISRYIWAESDGAKVLLNAAVIAAGGGALGDLEGDERYRDWFSTSEGLAKSNGMGLWSVCSGAHGNPLPTPTPPPPTPTPEPAGSRENPVPFGERVDLQNNLWIRVVDVIPDAFDLLIAENQFNDPAPEGMQYFFVTIEVGYEGSGSIETGSSYGIKAVGKSGVAYESGFDCGVVPNEFSNTELFEGGTVSGNVCWLIKSEDASSMVMFLGDGAGRVYFSLKKQGD